MDLSQLDTRAKATAGVDVSIKINGKTLREDGAPMLFRVRGIDSAEVQEALQAVRSADGEKTIEQGIEDDIAFCLAALVGWSENVKFDGKRLPFSPENARRILEIPVLRSAILAEVQNRANFMTGA